MKLILQFDECDECWEPITQKHQQPGNLDEWVEWVRKNYPEAVVDRDHSCVRAYGMGEDNYCEELEVCDESERYVLIVYEAVAAGEGVRVYERGYLTPLVFLDWLLRHEVPHERVMRVETYDGFDWKGYLGYEPPVPLSVGSYACVWSSSISDEAFKELEPNAISVLTDEPDRTRGDLALEAILIVKLTEE